MKDKTDEDVQTLVRVSVDESELNLNAVKEVYKGFYHEINVEKQNSEDSIPLLEKIIRFRNKTQSARKPPRILLVGPPCSYKYEIAQRLSKKLQIVHVSVSQLLNKEIQMNNDNSKQILQSMNKGELVNDKFVSKLLEDRLYASDCLVNGWIVTGYPKNSAQITHIAEMAPALKPSIFVVIDLDDGSIISRADRRRIDPKTGKIYYINSAEYQNEDVAIKKRLVIKNEDKDEVLIKRLQNWKHISENLYQNNYLKLNGEESIETLIQTVEDAVGFS